MIGVVSDVDLLRDRLRHRRPGSIRLTASELMSTPAVTVSPDTTVAEATRLLASGPGPLFVVDGGRLVGVLSRRDLLSVFRRPDKEVSAEVEHDILETMTPRRTRFGAGIDALIARISAVSGVDIKERTR